MEPYAAVDLADIDPRGGIGFEGEKDESAGLTSELNARLEELQHLLWAENKHKLLIILQALDAGGKDGVIRSVFNGVNPQGVKVANFKVPTELELAHDYLWRIHRHTPATGEIVIFNRSHYEDVLVVRVKELVPEERWRKRYHHINEFERLLADEGTTILKFFLNISKDEQRERFQSRLDEPHKRWKFSQADLEVRARWDDYQAAYAEMLSRTSTPWAPWYIVPADRKWYRDLVVSTVLIDTLDSLAMQWPEPGADLDDIVLE